MNWVGLANVLAAVAVAGMLNSLWVGCALAALAGGVLRAIPRSNATTRYAVWFLALLLVVAMPAVLLAPRPAPVATAGAPLAIPVSWTVPVTAEWPVYVVMGWLAIAAVLLARVVWSIAHIHGLKSRADCIGRRDNIRVLASDEIRVPMAAGFLRRAVIFPRSVLAELSSEEFEQVLAHELAHLRRWDDWTQLLQTAAEAVFFFNPVLYWIGRRLKIEREMACDDWVISATGKARPYAACLTRLHELTRRASAPQLAPGATTRTRWQITARVEALLKPDRNATPRFSRAGWMAAGALVTAGLIVATQTAPLVGVQELRVASLAAVHLSAPAAPHSLSVPKAVPAKPRLLASHMRRPARAGNPMIEPPLIVPDVSYMLVGEWRVDASPTYFVITVVFFAPPPPVALNRI